MADDTVGALRERANNSFGLASDLGAHVQKIAALLQAAINTGAGEEEDQGWLVSLAHDQAIEAKELYERWSLTKGSQS